MLRARDTNRVDMPPPFAPLIFFNAQRLLEGAAIASGKPAPALTENNDSEHRKVSLTCLSPTAEAQALRARPNSGAPLPCVGWLEVAP